MVASFFVYFNFSDPAKLYSEDKAESYSSKVDEDGNLQSDIVNLLFSFTIALLSNLKYHLVDAFPELCKAY